MAVLNSGCLGWGFSLGFQASVRQTQAETNPSCPRAVTNGHAPSPSAQPFLRTLQSTERRGAHRAGLLPRPGWNLCLFPGCRNSPESQCSERRRNLPGVPGRQDSGRTAEPGYDRGRFCVLKYRPLLGLVDLDLEEREESERLVFPGMEGATKNL